LDLGGGVALKMRLGVVAWVRLVFFILELAEVGVGLIVDAVETGFVAGDQVQGSGVVGQGFEGLR